MNLCPTCSGPRRPRESNPTFPFCSAQCRLVDLGKWLDGAYRVNGTADPELVAAELEAEASRKP